MRKRKVILLLGIGLRTLPLSESAVVSLRTLLSPICRLKTFDVAGVMRYAVDVRLRLALALVLITPAFGQGRIYAQLGAEDIALEEPTSIEQLHTEKALQFRETRLLGGLYSRGGSEVTELYLLNKTAAPLAVELAAVNRLGRRHPLGELVVRQQRHMALSLKDLLRDADPEFQSGTLEVWFWGDEDSLQAWTITRRGAQSLGLPLQLADKPANAPVLSFWDVRSGRGAGSANPMFYLHNGGTLATGFTARLSGGNRFSATVAPGASLRLDPRSLGARGQKGWIEIEQNSATTPLLSRG